MLFTKLPKLNLKNVWYFVFFKPCAKTTHSSISLERLVQNILNLINPHEGKVKSSQSSLCEIRGKQPLCRDPDRGWCHHHHTSILLKLFWSQPMAPWTSVSAYECLNKTWSIVLSFFLFFVARNTLIFEILIQRNRIYSYLVFKDTYNEKFALYTAQKYIVGLSNLIYLYFPPSFHLTSVRWNDVGK